MKQADATLKEQESPQEPVLALSTIHMHRASSIYPAKMPHRQVLVAKPGDTPIAAKLVSIDRATTLDMPKQDCGDCPAAGIPSARKSILRDSHSTRVKKGFLRPVQRPLRLPPPRLLGQPCLLPLAAERHIGLVNLNLAPELRGGETKLPSFY